MPKYTYKKTIGNVSLKLGFQTHDELMDFYNNEGIEHEVKVEAEESGKQAGQEVNEADGTAAGGREEAGGEEESGAQTGCPTG